MTVRSYCSLSLALFPWTRVSIPMDTGVPCRVVNLPAINDPRQTLNPARLDQFGHCSLDRLVRHVAGQFGHPGLRRVAPRRVHAMPHQHGINPDGVSRHRAIEHELFRDRCKPVIANNAAVGRVGDRLEMPFGMVVVHACSLSLLICSNVNAVSSSSGTGYDDQSRSRTFGGFLGRRFCAAL